ncbi:MAG: hypothetical protein MUF15_20345 [Acidobacteria bacterium]|nr:hypothetical protein [Acidobacteriota bacterium]
MEIKGSFDGLNFIGDNSKTYPIPANYASKSLLVEGDELLLRISLSGQFVYKQIKLIPRKKIFANVITEGNLKKIISKDGDIYKILNASRTFFDLQEGDEVIAIIPRDTKSTFAAIEAVSKQYEN